MFVIYYIDYEPVAIRIGATRDHMVGKWLFNKVLYIYNITLGWLFNKVLYLYNITLDIMYPTI